MRNTFANSEFEFFENYGLADLLYNYIKHTYHVKTIRDVLDTEAENDITEEDLYLFFRDVYVKQLADNFFLKRGADDVFHYTSGVSTVGNKAGGKKKPDIKKGEYMAPHIIKAEKQKMQTFELLESIQSKKWGAVNLDKCKGMCMKGLISPLGTKVPNPHKREYNSVSRLFFISSLVALTTRNKFYYYDGKAYTTVLPDFDDLETYVRFVEMVERRNICLGHPVELFQSKKKRPPIYYRGNLDWKLSIYSTNRFRAYDILSTISSVDKTSYANFYTKRWFVVSSDDARFDLLTFNEDILRFIMTGKKISDAVREFKTTVDEKYGTDLDESDEHAREHYHTEIVDFLDRFNYHTLEKILRKVKSLSEDNSLITTFINNTFNMNQQEIEVIKTFSRRVQAQMYYKAIDYVTEKGVVTTEKDKEKVEKRKFDLVESCLRIGKRASDMVDFLNAMSEFYSKHSIRLSMLTEDQINVLLGMDKYSDFYKLFSIFLKTRFAKVDTGSTDEDALVESTMEY